MIHSPTAVPERRRAPQRQQQPQRFLLNRQQQQQGSTDFQHVPAQAAGTAREVRSYVREASMNVDA